jgi:hypothetical protein
MHRSAVQFLVVVEDTEECVPRDESASKMVDFVERYGGPENVTAHGSVHFMRDIENWASFYGCFVPKKDWIDVPKKRGLVGPSLLVEGSFLNKTAGQLGPFRVMSPK